MGGEYLDYSGVTKEAVLQILREKKAKEKADRKEEKLYTRLHNLVTPQGRSGPFFDSEFMRAHAVVAALVVRTAAALHANRAARLHRMAVQLPINFLRAL